MSDITLSAGVRQNLLALQNTASLLATTQEDLATGKKVNSALDNPSNFFTSQSLNNRANDLNALLDSIGQAQQTVNAAESGITSLTNLVQSAKSIASQAQQATTGTVNFTAVTGTQAIVDDTTKAVGTNTVTSAAGTIVASHQASATLDAAGLANLHDGDTLTFQLGSGSTFTATFTTGTATTTAGVFNSASDLQAILTADFGPAAVVSGGSTDATVTSADISNDFTIGGTGLTHAQGGNVTDFATHAHTLGDALTVTDAAGHTASFHYVASGANAAAGTFSDETSLNAAINDPASNIHANITASLSGTDQLALSATNGISVTGAIGKALGYNSTPTATASYDDNFNTTLSGVTPGNLTIQVGSNPAQTITFGAGNGQVSTKAQLQAALAGLTDITGSLTSSGDIQLTPTSSATVTIGGDAATLGDVGLTAGTNTPVGTVVSPNSARASFQAQYNDLLTQIDQLAADSSYHGINLLNGDNLKVVFNENSTSSLTIKGVKFDSAGLGLTAVSGNGFQDNNVIDTTLDNIQTALTTLRTQAANFGSTETTVEARQDFTKDLINTLQTGADNLVLADTNQEGANLLALQTRQQLSITSLSLASQADQAILKVL
ncbi:MAG TPA: flagellin [Xanthobacteraceae bacterium]|jgi:flagellin-like hook-associated protein FlgL